MLTYTLATLKTHLQNWIEGNGTDADAEFTATLDEIIQMGESRVYSDLNLANLSDYFSLSTDIGDTQLSKDSSLLTEQTLVLQTTPKRTLIKRTAAFVDSMNQAGTEGEPKYYAEQDEFTWILAPIPDQVYTVVVRGQSANANTLRSLVDVATDTLTWLSARYAALLAAACEIAAADNLKNYARKADAEAKYTGLLDGVKGDTEGMRVPNRDASPRLDRQPMVPGDPSATL